MRKRPILLRFWRIIRMALGLVFSREEIWTIVESPDVMDAIEDARLICPQRQLLHGIMVERIPGLKNNWRVRYIYKGQ